MSELKRDLPPILPTARQIAELRQQVAGWRAAGLRVGLVPTMGALHAGHLSLIDAIRHRGRVDRVVVSIFVNPTQFGPQEDFARYPRQEAADLALLHQAGADLAYLPTVEEIYPPGSRTTVHVAGLTDQLEGPLRPGHFTGVATIVTKLLTQTRPDVAIFGEKDYQQLQVIRRLALDLDLDVEILGQPTLRDHDGLALSSRNAYLTIDQRTVAGRLPAILSATAAAITQGEPVAASLAAGRAALLAAGFAEVQYLSLNAADSLEPLRQLDRPARLLVAAKLGTTRLIDNLAVP